MVWELLEKVTGARLTHSFVRVGGMAKDCPTGFEEPISTQCLDKIDGVVVEVEKMLARRTRSSSTAWTASAR